MEKQMICERLTAFGRFNEWERKVSEKPDGAACLIAVFELYDLIPESARHRSVNVEGIMKMRRTLACLS